MRFYKPAIGATRINGGWCLMPRRIGNEARWLEWAEWVEQYTACRYANEWLPIRWAP